MDSYKFPKDFIWGSATASYQVEGAAREDGRGESIWDRFCASPGKVANEDNGDVACDHYHRYKEDIQLMKELGLKAYRFSIAWPRILPEGTGTIEERGLKFYSDLIDALLEAGIEPYVTLYHWDLPQPLQDIGGWVNPKMPEYFLEYSKIVFDRFGGRVKKWTTLNEPYCSAFLGYFEGRQAPGIQDFASALQASYNLYVAHGLVVKEFRERKMDGEIGITLNLMPRHSYQNKKENEEAVRLADGYLNRWFIEPIMCGKYPEDMISHYRGLGITLPKFRAEDMELIGQPVDFIGLNYYNDSFIQRNDNKWPLGGEIAVPGNMPVTDRQWPITPDGLEEMLVRLKEEYHVKKIYITENGASFHDVVSLEHKVEDMARKDYIKRHLIAVHRAIQHGVPVEGYFVWSLLDNFEWAFGYGSRFGIVYVDFETQERIIKESGRWYSACIARNEVVDA